MTLLTDARYGHVNLMDAFADRGAPAHHPPTPKTGGQNPPLPHTPAVERPEPPDDPNTGRPYFILYLLGWGGGWQAGNVLIIPP